MPRNRGILKFLTLFGFFFRDSFTGDISSAGAYPSVVDVYMYDWLAVCFWSSGAKLMIRFQVYAGLKRDADALCFTFGYGIITISIYGVI